MPKTIKNCFRKNLTFDKLMAAHQRARNNKTYKSELIRFEINLENNIMNLLNRIKNHTYHLGNYYSFVIYEPKKREIKALPYQDRIVHQWYVEEFIKPYIIPKFIDTTYACLPEKGTHKAVEQVQKYMRIAKRNWGNFWILKCDIHKFFYSIDPHILFDILQKQMSDKELIDFTKLLIFDKRLPHEKVGIPIGNYTSQFFANIYLNELDQYVKRTLHLPYYVRYMDDFILLLKTKQECIDYLQKIALFLYEHLHLFLNEKSRYYPAKMGVNFCGYRTFCTHRLLRTSCKKKIKKQVKIWNQLYAKNELDVSIANQSLQSWLGHSSHCDSHLLQEKIFSSCHFLYNSQTPMHVEKQLIEDSLNFSLDPTDLFFNPLERK